MTRVTIIQPSLAKYRVPVYRELAKRPGIDLQVIYGMSEGIPNVEPSGFSAKFSPLRVAQTNTGHILWHNAQFDFATRKHCDVLILSWDVHYASLLPALARARANGVATILWGHGYSKTERPWRAWLRQVPARFADVLLFYSQGPARTYVERYGWDQNRVVVASNALDQTAIKAARSEWLSNRDKLIQFKEKHGLDGRPVILMCSRLEVANRADLLLRATARLLESIPDVKVLVVGTGDAEPDLRRLSQELDLGDRVKFVGPVYDEKELAPWFMSADVYCYPQNIGLSLLHAFGYGLPVVTSDRLETHNPEIEALKPCANGLLYRHGDIQDLADSLQRLLTDKELRNELSEGARRTVSDEYSLGRMVDGFVEAIRTGTARRGLS